MSELGSYATATGFVSTDTKHDHFNYESIDVENAYVTLFPFDGRAFLERKIC